MKNKTYDEFKGKTGKIIRQQYFNVILISLFWFSIMLFSIIGILSLREGRIEYFFH